MIRRSSIETGSGHATKIDTETYNDPTRQFDASWSPGSRWVAYSKNLENHMRAIFVYSLDDQRAYQVTDGMSDAVAPACDASGKYLYFLAGTDYGPSTSWHEMSSIDRPISHAIYLAVLDAAEPSPLLPEATKNPQTKRGRKLRVKQGLRTTKKEVPASLCRSIPTASASAFSRSMFRPASTPA